MQVFKYKKYIHILNFISIIFNLLLFILVRLLGGSNLDIILILAAIIALFGFVNALYSKYIIDDEGIRRKTIFGQNIIKWSKISRVYSQPAGKLVKVSVVICSDKNIIINAWIKDYKKLLQEIINKCSSKKIQVDTKVCEICKQ
ncbi:UNVERIFIED_CONTAM: hypothetical protein Cloal_1788 [Acetivibrio alkalicellulosi]